MSNFSSADIIPGVRACVCDHTGVKKGDHVLILTDTSIDPLVPETFNVVARELDAIPVILRINAEMAKGGELGGEVSKIVVEAVKGADVVFGVTSYPMQHTPAIRSMVPHPGEDIKSHMKWMNVPPPHHLSLSCKGALVPGELTAKIVSKLLEQMSRGKKYHITTKTGTDLRTEEDPASYGKVKVLAEFPLPPGRFQVFPYGVMNPDGYVHSKGNGVMVVDAMDHFLGLLPVPIKYIVKDGYVEKVEGGRGVEWIEKEMQRVGKENGRPWWELSFGANPCIPIYQDNCEALNAHWHAFAHRAAGVIHVAFGIDPIFHLHGTILEPTLICEDTGEVIIKDGQLSIFEDNEIKKLLDKAGIKPSRWQ